MNLPLIPAEALQSDRHRLNVIYIPHLYYMFCTQNHINLRSEVSEITEPLNRIPFKILSYPPLCIANISTKNN